MVKNPLAMQETRIQSLEKIEPSWVRKIPGEGHGNPLQYSCLENPHGQRSLMGYSPWSCKGLDTTEQLTHIQTVLVESLTY